LQIHFTAYGRVQGVFFRVHVVSAAQTHQLTGWVRNLPEGTVEGEAQGEEEQLDRFMGSVEVGPSAARVDKVERREVETRADGTEVGFRKVKWGETFIR